LSGGKRFLVGDQLTYADLRLFQTLIRFDPVYHVHFKCSVRRIEDYPNLSNYVRYLYNNVGLKKYIHLETIENHYFLVHRSINPKGIIARGPKEWWF